MDVGVVDSKVPTTLFKSVMRRRDMKVRDNAARLLVVIAKQCTLLMLAVAITLGTLGGLVTTTTQPAYALDANSNYYLNGMGPNTKTRMAKLAKRVGAKKSKSKLYPTFFAKGKKVTIGVNARAEYPKAYVIIRNAGNKNLSIMGVKIGMSKKAAAKKLSAKYWQTYDGGKTYWSGNAARIVFAYRQGKVKAFRYICAPTS